MLDGHLGRITALKHLVELTDLDVRPCQCAPCLTGPNAQAVEREEIERILTLDVIAAAKTKWVVPTVIAPMKNKNFVFASITVAAMQLLSGIQTLFLE